MIFAALLDGDPLADTEFTSRFKMHGYHENKNWYYRIQCEKREKLDSVMKTAETELSRLFMGSTPIWRETELDPVTKMFIARGWSRSGWFEIPDTYIDIPTPPQETTLSLLDSGSLRWKDNTSEKRPVEHLYLHAADLKPIDSFKLKAKPTVLFFDLEAYRGDLTGFPDAAMPSDIIYMCSVVVSGQNDIVKYCICVGDPARNKLAGVTVVPVESEYELYLAFAKIIEQENPDVISGYNIHNFDLKYIEKRLSLWGAVFPNVSRLPGKISDFDVLRGPRGLRYTNLKCPGRIVLDVYLYLIKNTTRQELPNFDLKRVSKHYLVKPHPDAKFFLYLDGCSWKVLTLDDVIAVGVERIPLEALKKASTHVTGMCEVHVKSEITIDEIAQILGTKLLRIRGGVSWDLPDPDVGKIDLKYKDQFRLYLRYVLGFPDGPQGLETVAEYCVRDSDVLPKLFENRGIWETCIQFSNILGCTIQTAATAGQVEKLTPLMHKHCRKRETIMEINPDAGTMQFEGGLVHLTKKGRHENLCIGDFSSLYPSIIIWENLCWTTRVLEQDTNAMMAKTKDFYVCDLNYKVQEDTKADEDAVVDSDNDEAPEAADRRCPDEAAVATKVADIDITAEMQPEELATAIRKAKRAMALDVKYSERHAKVMYIGKSVKKGILPEVLENLLARRKEIRKKIRPEHLRLAEEAKKAGDLEMYEAYKQLADDDDKEQNATKVSCNSVYGYMGAPAGYADPFVGAVTTATGRNTIKKSTDLILAELPGQRRHVYTDTDSSMIVDDSLKALPTKWLLKPPKLGIDLSSYTLPDWCNDHYARLFKNVDEKMRELYHNTIIPHIEEKCKAICAIPDKSGIYSAPMKFEYEALVLQGIWFAKKFYIARVLDDEQHVKLKQRGILIRRGDYPIIVKDTYSEACFALLDGKPLKGVLEHLYSKIENILLGPELNFTECLISNDFKSLAEYKSPSSKMAVLARMAEHLGVPIQENSRVDNVMLSPPNQEFARESLLLAGGGKSAFLATKEMMQNVNGKIDRDHYFTVLISHVDKLISCVAVDRENDVIYICDRFVYARSPECECHSIKLLCTDAQYYCPNCVPQAQNYLVANHAIFTWKVAYPLDSLKKLYILFLRSHPDATLTQVRQLLMQYFKAIIELY